MDFLFAFIACVLIVMSGILLSNLVFFPRLRPVTPDAPAPRISVLVPARDEAAVIGETLARLDAQAYPDFEILLLDDHSTDATGEIARGMGGRVRVISGAALPAGWSGKNWACHQLAAQATGDLLL